MLKKNYKFFFGKVEYPFWFRFIFGNTVVINWYFRKFLPNPSFNRSELNSKLPFSHISQEHQKSYKKLNQETQKKTKLF